MKRVILCLLLLSVLVEAKYYDDTYIYVSTGSTIYKVQKEVDNAITDGSLMYSAGSGTWRNVKTSLTQVFYGYEGNSFFLQKINKSTETAIDLIPFLEIHGLAIENGYIYIASFDAAKNITKLHEHNNSVIWTFESQAQGMESNYNLKSMMLDNNYLYLFVPIGASSNANRQLIKVDKDLGTEEIYNLSTNIRYLYGNDLDGDFLYYAYELVGGLDVLGRAYKDNPTIEVSNYTWNGTGQIKDVVVAGGFIFIAIENDGDSSLEIVKLNKDLEEISNITQPTPITEVRDITNDEENLYISTNVAVYQYDFNLTYLWNYTGSSYAVGVSGYRGSVSSGSLLYTATIENYVDLEPVDYAEVYCELYQIVNETANLIDLGYSTDGGVIEFPYLSNGNYKTECTLDLEIYPEIIGLYTLTDFFIVSGNDVTSINTWYTIDSPGTSANFTFIVYDVDTLEFIEGALIRLYHDDLNNPIMSGFTDEDGQKSFRYVICNMIANITKENYYPYFYLFANQNNEFVHYIAMQKDYTIAPSPCYVDGYIEENSEPYKGNVFVRCGEDSLWDEYAIFGLTTDGYYNLSGIPPHDNCILEAKDKNAQFPILRNFKLDPKESSLYDGACLNCSCTFNASMQTIPKHRFYVRYNGILITDLDLGLYINNTFIEHLPHTPEYFYSGYIFDGINYTVLTESSTYYANPLIFIADDDNLEHNITVSTNSSQCFIDPFIMQSDNLFDSDNPEDVLEICYTLLDLSTGEEETRIYHAQDKEFVNKSLLPPQRIRCLDLYEISFESSYFNADTLTISTGDKRKVPLIVELKTKYDKKISTVWNAAFDLLFYDVSGFPLLFYIFVLIILIIPLFFLVVLVALLRDLLGW